MKTINYLKWQDYYKNTWCKDYENVKNILAAFKKDIEKFEDYKKFFASSVFLLQTYLRNHGAYYNGNPMIIKIAFRADFIEDGDAWILINDMVTNSQNYEIQEICKYCFEESFNIYENMQNKIMELLENHE